MSVRGEATFFLSGDVMTGRGVDQVLPHSVPPRLYEPTVTSALDYVALAERAHSRIPRPVDHAYVWGDALDVLARRRPDARIINLETAVTARGEAAPKGINYRMHPDNVRVLTEAAVDCCVLANNHVLDWGRAGLLETLEVLDGAGISVAGAGRDLAEAREPAALEVAGGRRVLVFAYGAVDSGIPRSWAAGATRPGVHLIPDWSSGSIDAAVRVPKAITQPGDIAVASIHWGSNWGFGIPAGHRRFARALIDEGGVDVVHGHSSHHPRAIEVHRGHPILYGCGDLLNDYEGIAGHEEFRGDLALLYLVTLDLHTGALARLEMVPLRIRGFRLNRASRPERDWLSRTLDRECRRFGHRVASRDGVLELEWR